MMKDVNVKSVRYPLAVDQKFEKVALKLGRTKRQIFIQMVDYFYKSKKDPADLNDEVLKKELSSGIHRIISFIRQQENELLVPIYSEVQELNATTRQHARLLERSEEHTSELKSLMRISYAVFCLKKKKDNKKRHSSLYADTTTTT